ncbi:hypothetical protein ACE1ET_09430 [Saccharicrinis sp. FJH62]|uniref:hypothetical protein n=1 Tax=Saccharicrinis sp. FJH62 TaxID=3344657 RepID=UPI0035D45953
MGHSLGYFELEKGFIWPDNSKLLANTFSLKTKKMLAGVLCIIAAICFVLSGVLLIIGHTWNNAEVIIAITLSTLLFIAFWDGSRRKLHTQGGVAILINILILFYTLI